MTSDTDDPEAAASRLEAALERIARAAEHVPVPLAGRGDMVSGQVATRLDSLIDRLRAELGGAA